MPHQKMITLTKKLILLSCLGATLSGCTGMKPGQTLGTMGGIVAGGALGSQIGGGTGRLYAAVAGALVGGLLGGMFGSQLDPEDRAAAEQATGEALAQNQPVEWITPSGHHGTVTPMPPRPRKLVSYPAPQTCRDVHYFADTGRGNPLKVTQTVCLDRLGAWRPVEQNALVH